MFGARPAPADHRGPRLSWARHRALGLGLGLGLTAALAGCASGPASSPDTSVGCSLTVLIPSFANHLLGAVNAKAGGAAYYLDRNVNTVPVACGHTATLTVFATHPFAHPFTSWTLPSGRSSSSQIALTVNGPLAIRAGFKVPKVSPVATPTPTQSPSPSPSTTSSTVTLDRWASYDSATQTLTLKLEAGYQDVNLGLNFDGEYKGQMVVTVPVGWTVTVDFSNQGSINHSAAVVTATTTTPVFAGASTPDPMVGTDPGQAAPFTFTASQVGSYRIACLIPGHEGLGMWDSFVVAPGGLPSVRL
ncbi:MAG: sulfocyanin-like copper-binding protein [Candidatus Dormiibacterota bacterium]